MICKNYDEIVCDLGNAKLLVVSKTQPNEKIMELYNHGVRSFGENRIKDLKDKALSLPEDIDWHFIWRMQTNKVREVIRYANLIHSVDSLKLLEVIDKECKKQDKIQKVLLQVKVADEENKTGILEEDLASIIEIASSLENVEIVGFMTMAPFTDDVNVLENVFGAVQRINKIYQFEYLSMGMSNDYKIALRYGANIIRVGSKIFLGE